MPRLADVARFGQSGQGGSWYDPPYPETLDEVTARWPEFEATADWFHALFPTGKLGIVGSAYAWTLYFLTVKHGRDVYGCDGAWAIAKAKNILGPTLASRVDVKSATSSAQMNEFRLMGNRGRAKYAAVLTEDVLPALSNDAEVASAVAAIRPTADTVVHLVTPASPNTATSDMLWYTPAQWRARVGTDRLFLAGRYEEVP